MILEGYLAYEFFRYALLSALILGPTCALIGIFVTLRGMAFFSDALAHSAVTGMALGYLASDWLRLEASPSVVVFVFCVGLALLMAWLMERTSLSPDTVIAFSFTGSVAFGVLVMAWLQKYRMLDGILFGSLYANGPVELAQQVVLAVVAVVFLLTSMRDLTLMTLSSELGEARGLRVRWFNYGFALLVAATVAVAMKMLGALLLSALIVIPAASAKLVSGSFRSMILWSLAIGVIAPVSGVLFSWTADLPVGPSIVFWNVVILAFCYFVRGLRRRV